MSQGSVTSNAQPVQLRGQVIESLYPSIAAQAFGGLVGRVMQIPMKISSTPLRLAGLFLFGALLSPLSVTAYALGKLTGSYHTLTTEAIFRRKILGSAVTQATPLMQIKRHEVVTKAGYKFYSVGDLQLFDASGLLLLTIPAVIYPERLAELIHKTVDAVQMSHDAQAVIDARPVLARS